MKPTLQTLLDKGYTRDRAKEFLKDFELFIAGYNKPISDDKSKRN